MIKKFVFALMLTTALPVWAAENSQKLPAPDLQGGKPLMETIAARKSTREFSAKKIDDTDLSNILFAAWGISHDGKRTIPTAKNTQDLEVYAVLENGIWRYNAQDNSLDPVTKENIKPAIALQDFVNEAPLTLIYTGKDGKNTAMNAAAAYQNVGLYCASRGLNNVVRGYVNKAEIAKALNLEEDNIVVTQTIGWPYM